MYPLKAWLPDHALQRIAEENNLSETAYFVKTGKAYHIRWFTPTTEVKLCGHATLASAHVLFNMPGHDGATITFDSLSGPLRVTRRNERLEMDFPADPPVACDTPAAITEAFGLTPAACLKAEDYVIVFDNEDDIQHADPDTQALKKLDGRGVIITACSREYDLVSRFFATNFGIDEDPVTGSSFTELVPYRVSVTGKQSFHAKQISTRGGEVWCELNNENNRVKIAGYAVTYMEGRITF